MKVLAFLVIILFSVIAKAQTGIITTVAGGGGTSGDGGPASSAALGGGTAGIIFDSHGNYYFTVADRVRKVSASGIIYTIAGTGSSGFSGDGGPASSAQLHFPVFLAVDSIDNIYIADVNNNRIRKIDATTGTMSTVAGNGTAGFSGDGGPATSAKLNNPYALCFDHAGNMYISDYSNERIRKVDTNGIISTIAGTGATYTNAACGDGGPATAAIILIPWGLTCDRNNNLYGCINGRVRKVDVTTGIISAFAGDTIGGLRGDGGRADTAGLGAAVAVSFDATGNLFICDMSYLHNDVRVVDTSGIIHTTAGIGTVGFSGDGGMADTAQLSYPRGVAADPCGDIYINDNSNFRIRKVTLHTPSVTDTPSVNITSHVADHSISGSADTVCSGTSVTYTATYTGGGTSTTYQWLINSLTVSGATGSTYTYIPVNGDSVQCVVTAKNLCGSPSPGYSNVIHMAVQTLGHPTIAVAGPAVAFIGSSVIINATITSAGSGYLLHWMNHGIEFTATTGPSVTYTKTLVTDSITARLVSNDPCVDSAFSGYQLVWQDKAGIANIQLSDFRLQLYPNPTKSALNIISTEELNSVVITSTLGQIIYSCPASVKRKLVVDVSNLPSGVYFVKVVSADGGLVVRRFLKE